jgi:malonate-semialdehyde dehydrogenase (acetylating)/methylmalonate-semialdehyde dehydrogenase
VLLSWRSLNIWQDRTIDQLVGAAFGASGQRCMALSAAVFVGESKNWYAYRRLIWNDFNDFNRIPEIIEKAKKLKVSEGFQPGVELGPVISPAVLHFIYIPLF